MKPIEPLSDDLKKALEDAAWPDAPADLEARQLPVLTAAWSAMAANAPAPLPGPSGAGLRRLFGSVGVWSTAAALVVGGAGGAFLHAQFATPAPAPAPKVVASVPPVTPAPVEPPKAEPQIVRVEETPPPPQPVQKERRVIPVVTAPVVSTLEAEQQLLDTARTAFLRREPERAMPVLDEYARKFPRGSLSEEHDALRIQGLCLLGRATQATDAARVFRQRYPGSVFLETVELSLKSLVRPGDE